MSWWMEAIYSHPCPLCGAGPGEPCRTSTGARKNEPHADRARAADRCPRCGGIVPAETGPLCPRCAKVRELELERVTRWKRHHP